MDIKKVSASDLYDLVCEDHTDNTEKILFNTAEELANYVYNLVVRYQE